MSSFKLATHAATRLRSIARTAASRLQANPVAMHAARQCIDKPIDYMRYAEFDAILAGFDVRPGMRVLDVSSPQWLSIYLADQHPSVEFVYTNIIEQELAPYRAIAEALGFKNLTYRIADVRSLEDADASFDRVVSVSVIEHVYPETGGDVMACTEVKRVLKPDGQFHLTVPFKDKRNVVFVNDEVFERGAQENNFFAREYDKPSFDALLLACGLQSGSPWYISERAGALAFDYHEWGPGKGRLWAKVLSLARRSAQRFLRTSLDAQLAARYLHVERVNSHRLVNVAAVLRKP